MEAQRITRCGFYVRRAWRLLLEATIGYGWKPRRLIATIALSYFVLLLLNLLLWNTYGITSATVGLSAQRSIVNDIYYTSTLLTTLGPMGLIPTTTTGLVMASIHSIVGVLFFALLASLMFRLVVKAT